MTCQRSCRLDAAKLCGIDGKRCCRHVPDDLCQPPLRGASTDSLTLDYEAYKGFVDALRLEVVSFGKPVMVAHGDSHYCRIDKPLRSTVSGRRLIHCIRVEPADMQRMRVVVDLEDDQVLTTLTEFVPENLDFPVTERSHFHECRCVNWRSPSTIESTSYTYISKERTNGYRFSKSAHKPFRP